MLSSLKGPREILRMRRVVRRSSELAGLPKLTAEEEDIKVKALVLEKETRKSMKCELDMPEFETPGGSFDHKVAVSFRSIASPGVQLRYTVQRLDKESEQTCEPNCHSPMYRKPFVLSEPGSYLVRAVAFQDCGLLWKRSLIATEKFVILPGASGTPLRTLPTQMVQGVLSIAGSTERFVSAGLKGMRAAIAQAANTVEAAVHLQISKATGKATEVGFSVEVQHGRSAQAMTSRLTDPSLVSTIAGVLKVDSAQVAVEAKAKALEEVLLSLSWTFPRRRASLGGAEPDYDYLDGSCLVYAEERLLDVVDFRGSQSIHKKAVTSARGWSAGSGEHAAVLHSGDVMDSRGGSHALRVRLSRLPAEATDCIFTLSAYNCRDLSRFVSPSMCIFDAECPQHQLSTYSVADAGTASAVVVCSLTREGGAWSVRAHCRTGDGTVRDYTPIEEAIKPIQVRYDRLRRRLPYILLQRLWQCDRALPCAQGGEEDVLLPLFDLREELFRLIMEFV